MSTKTSIPIIVTVFVLFAAIASAQDWPQWRGPDRDAKLKDFQAPSAWPQELIQKWKITVGTGTDSTPALVGDRLYVFTRQDANEVLLCLNAETGLEIWKDSYPSVEVSGPPASHPGPRSSPTVTDEKVITFGVSGILSCYNTASQKLLWRKDDFPGTWPQFYAAMSPVVTDGVCIGHFGGQGAGTFVAYDLATGDQKWKLQGAGPAYGSPSIMTVDDTKMVIFVTENSIVGLNTVDGTLLWEMPLVLTGRMANNTVTPVINGTTFYYGGANQGIKAIQITKDADEFKYEELWTNTDNSVQYDTPVLKDNMLYCLSQSDVYFCIDTRTGNTAWTSTASAAATTTRSTVLTSNSADSFIITTTGMGGGGGRGGRGGGMGGRGGGGAVGFGSVIDAGSVLIGLNGSGRMVVFEPDEEQYKELASYQVSSGATYAYPIISGNKIYVMDQTSLTLWTIE